MNKMEIWKRGFSRIFILSIEDSILFILSVHERVAFFSPCTPW